MRIRLQVPHPLGRLTAEPIACALEAPTAERVSTAGAIGNKRQRVRARVVECQRRAASRPVRAPGRVKSTVVRARRRRARELLSNTCRTRCVCGIFAPLASDAVDSLWTPRAAGAHWIGVLLAPAQTVGSVLLCQAEAADQAVRFAR